MNTDTVSVRADVTVEVVLRYLRMRGELPDKTDRLFVVDRDDRYLGTLALTRLLTEDPEKPVGDLLDPEALAHRARNHRPRRRAAVPGPRPRVGRRGRRRTASCWAASPSTTSSTSSAKKPRTKSCRRPACATRKTCSPACFRRRAGGSSGWASTCHRVPRGRGRQPLRRHHRKGRGVGRAHAHRRLAWAASPAPRP